MTYEEFKSSFKTKVNNLSYEKQLELAINICKELFFDYQKFYELRQFGDPDIIMDAINICQQSKTKVDPQLIKDIILKVEKITPDTEDFGDWDGSYALNCCTAVLETLEFLLDKNQQHVIDTGSFLLDTIDFKIKEAYNLPEKEVDSHPLMLKARSLLLSFSN